MHPNNIPSHLPQMSMRCLYDLIDRVEDMRSMGWAVTEHHVPRAGRFGYIVHVQLDTTEPPFEEDEYFYCKPVIQVCIKGESYKESLSAAQVEAGLDALRVAHPELFWPNPEQAPDGLNESDQMLQSLWATGEDAFDAERGRAATETHDLFNRVITREHRRSPLGN